MATATIARNPQTLFDDVGKYLSPPDVETIKRAYTFAAEAHAPQRRESGEPYINHPLAVAETLASIHMDTATIVAALCHDVSEDCNVPMAELESRFGREVARLVDGVTKLDKMQFLHVEGDLSQPKMNGQDLWAENMRKMFLAMAEDIRVVLIKLADRLHNMKTLQYRAPAKRRRVAQETMDIYAPLANRLGIWELKWQLEDLSFRHLEPEKYHEIADKVANRRQAREKYIQRVIEVLRGELKENTIQADLSGRPKHIYSIYRKMQRRGVDVDQIYDQLAVRVLVQSVQDCYTTLGVIHSIWRPLPGQFDDYIANPKESLYQSLHTTVLAVDVRPLEIQIRTHEMHQVAEYGVAAHWRYKEGLRQDQKFDAKVAWLRQLMDWQKDVAGGAQEFVDSLKTDIFQDQVYVFTPKGEIKELPSGATSLDFAYRIHTDVGHKCIGAKVNGRLVSLDTKLHNGDIVEIITAKGSRGPSRDRWHQAGRSGGRVQIRQGRRFPGGGRLRRHQSRRDRASRAVRRRRAAQGHHDAPPVRPRSDADGWTTSARRGRPAHTRVSIVQPGARRRHHRLHHPRSRRDRSPLRLFVGAERGRKGPPGDGRLERVRPARVPGHGADRGLGPRGPGARRDGDPG